MTILIFDADVEAEDPDADTEDPNADADAEDPDPVFDLDIWEFF